MKNAEIIRVGTSFYLRQGGVEATTSFHVEKSIGDAKKRSRAWRRRGVRVISTTPPSKEFDGATRKGSLLTWTDGRVENCRSVNEAKRRSRALQKEGTKVRVIQPERQAYVPAARSEPIQVVHKPTKKRSRYLRTTAKRQKQRPNWKMQHEEGTDDLNV